MDTTPTTLRRSSAQDRLNEKRISGKDQFPTGLGGQSGDLAGFPRQLARTGSSIPRILRPLGAGETAQAYHHQHPNDSSDDDSLSSPGSVELACPSLHQFHSPTYPELDLSMDTRRSSRDSLATARRITRSISRIGGASASLALNLAQLVQDDRKKMIVNNLLRQMALRQALQVVNAQQRTTPTNSPAIGGENEIGARVSRRQEKHQGMMLMSDKERLLIQVEKRFKGHTPWTARALTLIQCVVLVSMLCSGGLAPFGVGVETNTHTVPLLTGTTQQQVVVARNPYLGPSAETLMSWGSKWSACMRGHHTVDQLRQESAKEDAEHGCCVNLDLECGMTDNTTCASFGGTFSLGQSCLDSPTCHTIKLRPCCFGVYGQCSQLSERHCEVLGGSWSDGSSLSCSESNCLEKQCGMSDTFATDNHPNQFYRFMTAIFLHVGVIHFAINAVAQYALVAQVECVAGSPRTLLMYLFSGTFGFLVSALFSPDSLSNGSSAAIYGMLGVETVDLIQTWRLMDNRVTQVVGLVVKLAVFLGIGTLPYIDNFAHLGGFVFGMIAAMCCLPYLSFSNLDRMRKLTLKAINCSLIIALAACLLYKFYTSQGIVCGWCQYANCVPYTHSICRNVGG